MDLIFGTWHWSISGFLIGMIMLLLTYFGKSFGMSSNLRTMCSMAGAGKFSDFFKMDWREQKWSLAVVLGAIVGGFIAYHFISNGTGVNLNTDTISQLQTLGIDAPNGKLMPNAIFSVETLQSPKGFTILMLGGLLIGFGTRYAGGCTSGHAISGLSNFQLPSLVAVIGFFIGGLAMAHFILPIIFKTT
ncbi:YeeE/YedE family protein [Flavobacterium sp.]|uniref:YeeE/YedE family protein n=1 Tax=Flavobacterium sp. TaxID=239 RepID=UPI002FDE4157